MSYRVRNNPKPLTADNADYADKFIRSKGSIWTQTHGYLGQPLHPCYPRWFVPKMRFRNQAGCGEPALPNQPYLPALRGRPYVPFISDGTSRARVRLRVNVL